jgi:flagellar biosynthesis/type III secretory pathway chaperone
MPLACSVKFCVLVFIPVGLPLMLVNLHAKADPSAEGTLKSLTMSNVEPASWELWLYVVGAWYVTFVLLHLVDAEETVYIRARHRYLHQARPQDYSIFVQDLPPETRTSESLLQLFRQFYPASEIHSACVLPDCRALADIVTKAEAAAATLKNCVEAEAQGKTKKCCRPLAKVIPQKQQALRRLNQQLVKERMRVLRQLHTSREAERAAMHLEWQEAETEMRSKGSLQKLNPKQMAKQVGAPLARSSRFWGTDARDSIKCVSDGKHVRAAGRNPGAAGQGAGKEALPGVRHRVLCHPVRRHRRHSGRHAPARDRDVSLVTRCHDCTSGETI